MPPAGTLPFDVLLQGLRRDAEESGPDEAAGRDLPGRAVLRRPPDGPDALQGGALGQPETNRPADLRKMGLEAVYRRPNTSRPHPEHKIFPYLLRDVAITRSNQVWCADVTYIPMRRGFLYLVAIMDWHSRKVLSWQLSNSMEASFCVEALSEALERYGTPEIFNTDQGSQFTSTEFVGVLENAGVRVSMDGRGRWMDNVMVERLWRSLKYENVYLNAYETGTEARKGIGT